MDTIYREGSKLNTRVEFKTYTNSDTITASFKQNNGLSKEMLGFEDETVFFKDFKRKSLAIKWATKKLA